MMYCRNCGKEIADIAAVCTDCGVPKGAGDRFCYNCGSDTSPLAVVCIKCGCALRNQYYYNPSMQKSKIAAGLLGIFLGCFGVHNFYLGYTSKAVIQLVLGILGFATCGLTIIASSIWGLIEGIMILTGSINVDGKNIPLGE